MYGMIRNVRPASKYGLLRKGFLVCPVRSYYMEDRSEPFSPIPGKMPSWSSDFESVFTGLKDGAKIFVQGGSSTPTTLLEKLHDYVLTNGLKNIQLYHLFTLGPYPFCSPECEGIFSSRSLFVGHNVREYVNQGKADFYPIMISEIPNLFRRNVIGFDMALISVSPPNKHNYLSLGPSVDITRSAIQHSKCIIGQVNPNVPVTLGDANIHISHLDYMLHGPMPLHETHMTPSSKEEVTIGKYISEKLVDDGATIEAGIGAIPQSVLNHLSGHRNLGIHTEMISDSLVDLVSVGVVTNALKTVRPGKIVSSFVLGTRKVFDFIDNNPLVDMVDVALAASPVIIARNPKPTCINTCLAIDMSGQVAADSIGYSVISGVGGLIDFIRGASLSMDGHGKAILALTSRDKNGKSKIVPELIPGTGVTVSRAHVHYVVTEYGIAYLFGRNLRQRAYALIQIAHPDDREELEKYAFNKLKVMPSPD